MAIGTTLVTHDVMAFFVMQLRVNFLFVLENTES